MRIPPGTGQYVGLGEGDFSSEVAEVTNFILRKWDRFDSVLVEGNWWFTPELTRVIRELQDIYISEGRLDPAKAIRGVVNLEMKYAMGYLKRPERPRPIIFTIGGHLSNGWVGPSEAIASRLEQDGLCWWQPVVYDSQRLPFNNDHGRQVFRQLLGRLELDDGRGGKRPFPAGTPWGLICHSQGAIIGCSTYLDHIREGSLSWRHADLQRVLMMGNPYRQKDVVAPWIADPPKRGTQGISDRRMDNTPAFWREVGRTGDIYTENPDSEVGLNRTAIYKIVSENSWVGGPAGMLARVLDLFTNPLDGVMDIAMSIMGGVMFLGNMQAHDVYDLNPCLGWMAGVGG